MRHITPRALALACIIAVPLIALPGQAQEATPPGADPTRLEPLLPVWLPEESALSMARVTLGPGEVIPLHPHASLEMVFVVAGGVTLRPAEGPAVLGVRGAAEANATPEAAGPGAELSVAAGDVVIVPPGNAFGASAGTEGVTVLIFVLSAQSGDATPAE